MGGVLLVLWHLFVVLPGIALLALAPVALGFALYFKGYRDGARDMNDIHTKKIRQFVEAIAGQY